jgi:hypothetical protein
METNLSEVQNPAAAAVNFVQPSVWEENLKNGQEAKTGCNEPLIYEPHWISGGMKHPGLIVETPGLANVAPPPITYRPHLPNGLNNHGLISGVQFERIIYAGQAHEQRLANGAQGRHFHR